MEPKNKFTEAFFNEFTDIIKLSLCLYWPFLMILLVKGMKNNENTK